MLIIWFLILINKKNHFLPFISISIHKRGKKLCLHKNHKMLDRIDSAWHDHSQINLLKTKAKYEMDESTKWEVVCDYSNHHYGDQGDPHTGKGAARKGRKWSLFGFVDMPQSWSCITHVTPLSLRSVTLCDCVYVSHKMSMLPFLHWLSFPA